MAPKGTEIPIGDSVFRVGDRVVYPNQGICRITGVSTLQIAGQTLEMVSLAREEDAATVRVPMAKVAGVGLRKVASAALIDEMFDYLAAPGDDPQLDWKIRHRENADKMTGGGLFGTVEVLKGLHALTRIRPLPQKERELYDSARHLLVSETAAAMGIPLCTAEDNLDFALFPPPGMKRNGVELQLAIVPATGTVRPPKGDDGDDDEDGEEDAGAEGETLPLPVTKLKALKLAPPLEDEDADDLPLDVLLGDDEEKPPAVKAAPPPARSAPRSVPALAKAAAKTVAAPAVTAAKSTPQAARTTAKSAPPAAKAAAKSAPPAAKTAAKSAPLAAKTAPKAAEAKDATKKALARKPAAAKKPAPKKGKK